MQSEFKQLLADFRILDALNMMLAIEKQDSSMLQSHNDILA